MLNLDQYQKEFMWYVAAIAFLFGMVCGFASWQFMYWDELRVNAACQQPHKATFKTTVYKLNEEYCRKHGSLCRG